MTVGSWTKRTTGRTKKLSNYRTLKCRGVTFWARMTGLSVCLDVDSFILSTSNLRIRTQFWGTRYLEIQTTKRC